MVIEPRQAVYESCRIVLGTSWITGNFVFWARAESSSGLYNAGESEPLRVTISWISGVGYGTRKNRSTLKRLREQLIEEGWKTEGSVGANFWDYTFRRLAVPTEDKPMSVVLKERGPQKLEVVRIIRELLGLGLKEALDLTENPPRLIMINLTKDSAEAVKGWFTKAGAHVDIV